MLDSHIVNIRNEVDNWLLSFNEAISDKNSKTDSIENLNKLFFEESRTKINYTHIENNFDDFEIIKTQNNYFKVKLNKD